MHFVKERSRLHPVITDAFASGFPFVLSSSSSNDRVQAGVRKRLRYRGDLLIESISCATLNDVRVHARSLAYLTSS